MLRHVKILAVTLYFLAEACESLAVEDDNPVVTIEDGRVMGRTAYTVGQNSAYYAFQGIPYATPPLDNLRFTDPVKNSNWTGILDATADKSQCVQGSDPVVGSEDCLYINVYTPSLTATNVSVMVWIYGGGFTGGNSSYEQYGPDYLLDEGVIFVSLNYRLGVFGFISTGDRVCSGNWGLKDQVLALRWVQSNIGNFGGNPQDVTIFGQSSGSASVSYLLQTNKTTGLFQKAIMQSGTSLNLWALNRRAQRTAFSIGAHLWIITTDSSTLITGLRQTSYVDLQTAATAASTWITLENPLTGIYFGPVIEPDYDGALFVSYSEELLSQGGFHQIPTIIGCTSNEVAAIGSIPGIFRLYLINYDIKTKELAPMDLTTGYFKRWVAAVVIKVHYFGIGLISASTNAVIQFFSDDQFNRPIRRAVIDQSKYAPVYYYVFSYEGGLGGVTNRTLQGVGHVEDLGYIFVRNYTGVTENDTLVRSMMVEMWTNFAKYGNPTPPEGTLLPSNSWKVAGTNPSSINFLNITVSPELQQNPFSKSMSFYDCIYSIYGDNPYNTY